MKTSKQERLEEFEYLGWRNDQGRLFTTDDVRRYAKLYKEFRRSETANGSLKPVKVVEAQ